MKVYAAYTKDDSIRMNSSSGGIFSALASQFDVVYGVSMDNDCRGASIVRVVDYDIGILRGSKYLQATPGDSFKSAKKDLEEGKTVLFSGTGCQISGLKSYLGKEYNNLLCVDIICHGVPSQALWNKYVEYQEANYGEIRTVSFRSKEINWKKFGIQLETRFFSKEADPYMQFFLRNYCLRPSCYECNIKTQKQSDITLGDFWGIEDVAPEMDDENGTSLVIIRTDRGQVLFDLLKNDLHYKEVDYKSAVKKNRMEYESAKKPVLRNTFYKDLNRYSFKKMVKLYLNPNVCIRALRKIRRILIN